MTKQASLHINVLELLAIGKSLQGLLQELTGKRVLVKSDNATAVAYIF